MRLREIEFYLTKSKELLEAFNAKQVNDTNPPRTAINALQSVRSAMGLINKIGVFPEELDTLRFSSISNNNLDSIQVTSEEFVKIRNAVNSLKINSQVVLDSIRIALPEAGLSDTVIYVKLPEIKDFDDLSKFLEQLKKAIQLPISLDDIGGEISISNFDSGSRWFEIAVKTTVAASLIGSIAWSGAVIYKKYNEALIVEEHAKRVQLGSEHLNALIEANKAQMNLLITAEAQYIQKVYFKNPNPEDLERLKLSIKTMSEMIEKGAEIQPAILAPEEVSNLFPNYSNLLLIESKQKLIEK